MDEHHEARLLLAVLAEDWSRAETLRTERSPDTDTLLRLAADCGVQPWLHELLRRTGRAGWFGDDLAVRLAMIRHRCRIDNAVLLGAAPRALDALLERGIVPIVLKGWDLVQRFDFPFDARSMHDVDLLVRTDQAAEAMDALIAAGWSKPEIRPPARWHPYHQGLYSEESVPTLVELHWNIVQFGRYRLDPDELHERAEPVTIDGRRVLALERDDLAAHLLLHQIANHLNRNIKSLIDLQQLQQLVTLDWATIATRLRAWGAGVGAALAVRQWRKLLPARMPPDLESLFPLGPLRRLALGPTLSDHPLDLFKRANSTRFHVAFGLYCFDNPLRLPAALLRQRRRYQALSSRAARATRG